MDPPVQVTNKVFLDIDGGSPEVSGRVVLGLYGNVVPKTVKNFVTLGGQGGRAARGRGARTNDEAAIDCLACCPGGAFARPKLRSMLAAGPPSNPVRDAPACCSLPRPAANGTEGYGYKVGALPHSRCSCPSQACCLELEG